MPLQRVMAAAQGDVDLLIPGHAGHTGLECPRDHERAERIPMLEMDLRLGEQACRVAIPAGQVRQRAKRGAPRPEAASSPALTPC